MPDKSNDKTVDPTVEYLIICDHAFTTEHRQPCLIGILTYLVAPAFPYHRAWITLAAHLRVKAGSRIDIRFEFGPESGDEPMRSARIEMGPVPGQYVFAPIQVVQVTFRKAGVYVARIVSNGATIAERSLRIIDPSSGDLGVGTAAGVVPTRAPQSK